MNQSQEDYSTLPNQNGGGIMNTLSWLFYVIMMILAGYLAWTCFAKQSTPVRVLFTFLAVIFNLFYLVFYVIYHVLLKNPCF